MGQAASRLLGMGPAASRLTGLAGAVLMTAGAWLDGAWITGQPNWPGLGIALWFAGIAVLAVGWWPLATGRITVPARWLTVTGLLWALPLLLGPVTGSRDVYSYACQGAIWLDGGDPYTAGAAAGGCPWMAAVAPDWQQSPSPYGAVAIMLSAAVVALARTLPLDDTGMLAAAVTGFRFLAVAAGILIARFAPRIAPQRPTARETAAPRPAARGIAAGRPDDRQLGAGHSGNGQSGNGQARSGQIAVALGLLTPLTAVHLVGGAHHDALIAGLLVASLAIAATHNRPWPARPTSAHFDPSTPTTPPPAAQTTAGQAHTTATGSSAPASGTANGGGWAMARGHPVIAGALVGLAAGIKVTAIVAVPFVALLAAAAAHSHDAGHTNQQDHTKDIGRTEQNDDPPAHAGTTSWATAWVVIAAVAVFAGTSLVLGFGWLGALKDTGKMVQWTSVPTAVGMTVGYVLRAFGLPEGYATAVIVARAVGLAVLAGIGVGLFWRAVKRFTERNTVLRCAGWGLAAVAVLSPVFYPWYALPALAILATTAVRPRVVAAVTVGLSLLILPDGLGLAVRTKLPGAFLVSAALGYGIWRAAGSRRRRAVSVVRRDDPATPRSTG